MMISSSVSSFPHLEGGVEPVVPIKIRKSLQNPPESPWFDWICEGKKKFEGRLKKDDWASLSINDHVTFVCPEGRELITRVLDLPTFDTFGDAFDALGSELVPVPGVDTADVINIYGKYYKNEDVVKYGVIAVKVEPIFLKSASS